MKEAQNVVTKRMVEFEVLKIAGPMTGEAKSAITREGHATESSKRRVVRATAPEFLGSGPPIFREMNRVAASGRETWVTVVKTDIVAASRDTCPIWAKFRIRINST